MEFHDAIEGIETIKDFTLSPGHTIRKKTALAYGTAILAAGTLCGEVYAEPSIVEPCTVVELNALTSTSSVAATPTLFSAGVVVYVSS